MARLTIEDKWWSDPRREKLGRLLGGMEMADAAAIRAWRLAQEFWGHGHKLIPSQIFETLEASPKLIEAGLAIVQAEGIYIRGSSQYLSWLHEKRLSASAGGKKSAATRRAKKGTAQPKPRSKPEADSNTPRTEVNTPEPSGSGSFSVLGSKNEETKGTADAALPAKSSSSQPARGKSKWPPEVLAKATSFVAAYVKAYQTRWPERRPEDLLDGKVRGQILNWVADYPIDRACELIQAYFQMETKWFGTKGYDFLTFRSNLNKIAQALDTGVDPEGGQIDWSKVNLSGAPR